ncbi:MAG: RidA family protein [Trichlorobacter sp.]|jgi:2-iminobutanoate/2-iminopropanoate deaminase|nr:RidA family protein [Trichlorobacter sp.]
MQTITTPNAPAAIGPYSQAVKSNNLLFCSGQIPLIPETGEMLAGDIKKETEQVMKNLSAVLVAAGSSFDKVVKTTIYLTDMNDFPAVNEIYGSFFEGQKPARSTIAVAALPKGARVEIDAVATV